MQTRFPLVFVILTAWTATASAEEKPTIRVEDEEDAILVETDSLSATIQ